MERITAIELKDPGLGALGRQFTIMQGSTVSDLAEEEPRLVTVPTLRI